MCCVYWTHVHVVLPCVVTVSCMSCCHVCASKLTLLSVHSEVVWYMCQADWWYIQVVSTQSGYIHVSGRQKMHTSCVTTGSYVCQADWWYIQVVSPQVVTYMCQADWSYVQVVSTQVVTYMCQADWSYVQAVSTQVVTYMCQADWSYVQVVSTQVVTYMCQADWSYVQAVSTQVVTYMCQADWSYVQVVSPQVVTYICQADWSYVQVVSLEGSYIHVSDRLIIQTSCVTTSSYIHVSGRLMICTSCVTTSSYIHVSGRLIICTSCVSTGWLLSEDVGRGSGSFTARFTGRPHPQHIPHHPASRQVRFCLCGCVVVFFIAKCPRKWQNESRGWMDLGQFFHVATLSEMVQVRLAISPSHSSVLKQG